MATTVTYPASLENLAAMIQQVVEAAIEVGFADIDLARIELVAEEIFVNIVSYGFAQGADDQKGEIIVACTPTDKQTLQIVVQDDGIEFDPVANAQDIDVKAPLEDRSYGGYGVFFMLKIMDNVTYERVDDKNVLTMIKRRSA